MVICTCLLSGCGMMELETKNYPSEKEREEGGTDIEKTVFMSAVVFPDGYDWQNDPQWDEGRESLLLIAGDRIVAELDSDGPDDIHFIMKGALYQCVCRQGRTAVLRNGEAMLEWPGEETVYDLAIDGKDLLALCSCASETGGYTCLRRNGQILRRYDGCFPTSDLYEDGRQLLFGVGGARNGFAGPDSEHLPDMDVSGIYDQVSMICGGGRTWLYWTSGQMSGAHSEDNYVLRSEPGKVLGLLHDGADVFVETYTAGAYVILKDFKELYSSQAAFSRVASVAEGEDIYALGRLQDGNWAIFHNGMLTALPKEVTPVAGAGLTLRYGRLMFPLVMEDGTAAIWDNGSVVKLDINGYVDHICLGRGSSRNFWMTK